MLDKHIQENHVANGNTCDKGNFKAHGKDKLKVHNQSEHMPTSYRCDERDSSLETRIDLKRHVNTHGQEKIKCSECCKTFVDRTQMTKHIRTKHDGKNVGKQICYFCGKIS